MSNAAIVSVLIYGFACVACATGGQADSEGKTDAAVGHHDASSQATVDAPRVKLDGGVTGGQDAQVSQVPQDAPVSSGPFCTANNQCTNAGECCVTLGGPSGFCAPGDIVLGQCFPQ